MFSSSVFRPTNKTSYLTRSDELESKYDVNVLKLLGCGAYGKVYHGVNRSTGKDVAVKKIRELPTHRADIKRLLRELVLLNMLAEHPNIVSIHDIATVVIDGVLKEIALVFELFPTDLSRVINSRQTLDLEHIQYFGYQLLCGIYSVHEAGLVHRDLKPANLLVKDDCTLVICDFGLGRATRTPGPTGQPYLHLTPQMVTLWYRSPELLFGCRGAGAAPTDMWSIGCILAELLLRQPLFQGKNEPSMVDLIFALIGTPVQNECEWVDNEASYLAILGFKQWPRQHFQEKFKMANESLLDLLAKLLEFNPSERITAEQALRHPFFSSLFASQDLLTIPLTPLSAVNQRSLDNYYQFETQLEAADGQLSSDITLRAKALLLEEIGRYTQASDPTPAFSADVVSPDLNPLSVAADFASASASDFAPASAASTPTCLFYFSDDSNPECGRVAEIQSPFLAMK